MDELKSCLEIQSPLVDSVESGQKSTLSIFFDILWVTHCVPKAGIWGCGVWCRVVRYLHCRKALHGLSVLEVCLLDSVVDVLEVCLATLLETALGVLHLRGLLVGLLLHLVDLWVVVWCGGFQSYEGNS